jgi:hypothetical protein
MRTLICSLALAATVLAIPTAQALRGPGVSLSVSSFEVGYGKAVRLSGTVLSHKEGVPVSIVARSFARSQFDPVVRVRTGPGGKWTARVKPAIATTYMARAGGSPSRQLTVGVHPELTIQMLEDGRLQVRATAARSFNGRSVKLQRKTPNGWNTLTKLTLGADSTAPVPGAVLPFATSKLRAAMSVNQAGMGYLGSFSRTTTYPARWVSIALSRPEVVYGQATTLAGRISLEQPGMTLTIYARSLAKPEFQPLATVTTGTGGRWSLRTTPAIGTAYQAEFRLAKSRAVAVGVHPTIEARVVSGARLAVRVEAAREFKGRDVQVQQLTGATWTTVAKQALNGRSGTVFPASALPGGTSTLRVAMSVNQAGVGYLGAISDSFVYQR